LICAASIALIAAPLFFVSHRSAFPVRRILALADFDKLELPRVIGLLLRALTAAALFLVVCHLARKL
jgi:hypothetical protein